MASRPNSIDLRSRSHEPFGADMPSPSLRSLPSPRLHIAGEVPPELSPLDAFAAQSRQLARQLEKETVGGRRASRLPPLTIANSLSQVRPGYLRSVSADGTAPLTPTSPPSGQKTEVETPGFRPVSVHPTLGVGVPQDFGVPPMPSLRPLSSLDEEEFRGRRPPSASSATGEFGVRTEQSPPSLEREQSLSQRRASPSYTRNRPSADSVRQRGLQPRRGHDGTLGIGGYDSRALAPPRTQFTQRTPSLRSMSNDSSDEDFNSVNHSTGMSLHRKTSAGSAFSTSPQLPPAHLTRSPSISSELSTGSTRLPRPAFNFSRPLSRASTNGPSFDVPSRQASSDSQPPIVFGDDTAHTPVSMHSEGFPDTHTESGPAPSYVYSKFSLPRGKMLQRNSLIFQEGQSPPRISWEQPVPFSDAQAFHGQAPPSPPSRPSTSSLRLENVDHRPSLDLGQVPLDPGRPNYDRSNTFDFGRPVTSAKARHQLSGTARTFEEPPTLRPRPKSSSEQTTNKVPSQHSVTMTTDITADEHVTKAIDYHEAGALNKSTYHLRLAAKQNHPTGMLLYALACRHGWGMRPNQREGVAWLRRAADFASLEVADDEDHVKEGKAVDVLEQRARKAQFALSIYELGVSHMNGWGIEQDKVLALRCFEIAGSWGDADALAEAGFCYAQGMGCKKDLKKSARFYRQAEAKGVSMVGNSWIYKPKYNDDDSSERQLRSPNGSKEKDKKLRNKSRTRTMFGRKS
ncbi:cell cycle inhibitor protein [Diplocarpon rosae]|nr:cell cycle inhibitor protein [Diplocarpon rosae]